MRRESAGSTSAIWQALTTPFEGGRKKEVATILTCDHTGPLLVSIWSPTLDEFKNIMEQYNPQNGHLMLRFEQLRFSLMPMSEWNGNFVTPMRVAHTLTPEPESPMKKTKNTSNDCVNVFARRQSIDHDPQEHFPLYAK